MENRKTKILLHLIHLSMLQNFNGLLLKIRFLVARKLTLSVLESANQTFGKTFCKHLRNSGLRVLV